MTISPRLAIAAALVACGVSALSLWRANREPTAPSPPAPPPPLVLPTVGDSTSVTCFWSDSAETCLARVEAAYKLGAPIAREPTATMLLRHPQAATIRNAPPEPPPQLLGPLTADEYEAWLIGTGSVR